MVRVGVWVRVIVRIMVRVGMWVRVWVRIRVGVFRNSFEDLVLSHIALSHDITVYLPEPCRAPHPTDRKN